MRPRGASHAFRHIFESTLGMRAGAGVCIGLILAPGRRPIPSPSRVHTHARVATASPCLCVRNACALAPISAQPLAGQCHNLENVCPSPLWWRRRVQENAFCVRKWGPLFGPHIYFVFNTRTQNGVRPADPRLAPIFCSRLRASHQVAWQTSTRGGIQSPYSSRAARRRVR